MESLIARAIYESTPKSTHLFVRKCAELSLLINRILKDRGMSRQTLAKNLDKSPSEITKWLSGEHNLTLKSLCMLEAELGEEIISIPKVHESAKHQFSSGAASFSRPTRNNVVQFSKGVISHSTEQSSLASCAS